MHYLDNSATTQPCEAAVNALTEAIALWGNPSSVHHLGRTSADALAAYRRTVAKTLGLPRFSPDKLLFTSCGTESNNIAMLGCAAAKKRTPNADGIPGTIVISDGEHPSIENPAVRLSEQGYALVRVPTKDGVLDLDFLKNALENAKKSAAPVIFAAFMLVNNETGAVYDVKAASSLIKRYFPDAVVHCDAVQGYLKLRFTPTTLGADTISVSAHKIHAPRGAAALYISGEVIKRKNIVPVMPGGGQEDGFRSGTENLLSIAAFAAAAESGYANGEANRQAVSELRAYLNERLAELADAGVTQNLPAKRQLDNIASVVIPGVRSETMLNHLSAREVYVSAGSACSAHSKKKSGALTAFGAEDDRIDSTIRVSLSYTNTREDIDALIEGLRAGIADLQKK
ncbi:MAG: aminotransferase class V-fold PLP-dependent enzyme [Clostridia bacterium]|nr:aminotransferase class V-fold PLP-dependent enzyme [Clostridia bacterium]